MSIKTWIILSVNTLLVAVVVILSISFYQQFKSTLDQRVMLQLNSIKILKHVQIESYLNREWTKFLKSDTDDSSNDNKLYFSLDEDLNNYKSGIHDISHINPNGLLTIALIENNGINVRSEIIEHSFIQEILLERTGMGNTGETYIVGEDNQLRSQSRFYPNRSPYGIQAKTKSTANGLSGKSGSGIILDYRGINVYSSYQNLNLSNINWVIISEMDVEEVQAPMRNIRNRLIVIAIVILIIAILLSLYLARALSSPISLMQNNLKLMSEGNYNLSTQDKTPLLEINNMFIALNELQQALSGAVEFSSDIGEMNLQSIYEPKSTRDLLGQSLIKMRDKLYEFKTKESQSSLMLKKVLLEKEEEERKRIAMGLHDGIGPLLTTLKLYIQNNISNPTKKAEIKLILDETISEIRTITNDLMPPALIDFGVGQALENFVSNIRKTSQINIHFENSTKEEDSAISIDLGINIYRVCQELINNTIKHAKADKIVVTLIEFEEKVSLYYFDNGNGYDPSSITSGSGLANIMERIRIFDGMIIIRPEKHNATVEIEIPI